MKGKSAAKEPETLPRQFLFATGIENSYPTIKGRDGKIKRIDEMKSTRHYEEWREDFELTKELGISTLRYGPPYYRTHTGPGRYHWQFTDETFGALRKMKILPIADLCHFGLPDWLENFQNPDWPHYFAEYAGAFARRYSWVRFFTPVNEIFVAAKNSALRGYWNERLKSDRAFVTAIKHLSRATLLAQQAILQHQPRATFVQSEATQCFHPEKPACRDHTNFLNEQRFLALDLIYGNPINSQMFEYLLDNGMTRREYDWFAQNHAKKHCILGNDYYARNEHMVHADGSTTGSGEIFGYYVITRQYYERYRLPIMHTETNCMNDREAPRWLQKEWHNLHRLKLDGVPILGFTWYSLTDQVDWDTSLSEDNGRVNPCGLCDLDRNLRPVGKAYKKLISQWRDLMPLEHDTIAIGYGSK